MTSAAMQARTMSPCSGFVMAEVMPEAIAMVRNALLMPSRAGRPKLMFEAPQVVLTLSSSRNRLTSRMTCTPAWLIAPIGITSGSTTTSLAGMPWSIARCTIFLRDLEADVRILGNAGLVVRDRDDRGAVLLHERQHRFESLFLAGDRVDERLAPVDRETRGQRGDDRRVDRQRHVGDRLHELHGPREDRRLVGERDARVDVEHVRAGRDLRERIRLDAAEIAGRHLGGEQLAPGRVDALADDDERAVEADDDLAGGGADDGIGHERAFLSAVHWLVATRVPRDAALEHAGSVDDLGDRLFLPVRHDVDAVDALDLAHLLHEFDAEFDALARLVLCAFEPRDHGVGDVHPGHVRAHPHGRLRRPQRTRRRR